MRPDEPLLIVIGPVPPPMHGAALVTERLVDEASRCGDVRSHVSSGPFSDRFSAYLGAAWAIPSSRNRRRRSFYLSVSGRLGQVPELLLLFLARLFAYSVYVHHHSFRYLNRQSSIMSLLVVVAGPRAEHLVLCETMAVKMRGRYGVQRVRVLDNAAFVPSANRSEQRPSEVQKPPPSRESAPQLRVGHLSNLSVDKGLLDVLQTFRRLCAMDARIELVLAGSPVGRKEHLILEDAQEEFGSHLQLLGHVEGAEKESFLAEIDCLIFPSAHVHEAAPLVVLEALSHGALVIATDLGCISEQLRETASIVVDGTRDFADQAVVALMEGPRTESERRRVTALYAERRVAACGELAALIEEVFG